jgi:uncharacterized protein (DUF1697 family)
MTTYIAFLRSINVGGHNVTMIRLRELFSELGLINVRSYIQTGNIFFETNRTDRTALTKQIEDHLESALGYPVPTMLRTIPEIEAALALDPFKSIDVADDIRFFILLISKPLPSDLTFPDVSPTGEFKLLAATDGEVLMLYRQVKGRTGNVAAYLEKRFKISATARFWHTMANILEAAKAT